MVEILVFPNKLDRSRPESCCAEVGQTLSEWLVENVPAYQERPDPLFTARLNGAEFSPDQWSQYVFGSSDWLELTIEPRDPLTIALAVVAVVAAGAAIYAASQIPDNYARTTPDGSPIYDVNAQGNRPRLMGLIPEIAGRHKVFPDYLCRPHRFYQDNEQWLHLMLCVGVGQYATDPEESFIGNTPITQYSGDIECEIFQPGAVVSGNPAHRNIYTSAEVGGTAGTGGIEVVAKVSRVQSVGGGKVRFSGVDLVDRFTVFSGFGGNDPDQEPNYYRSNWPGDWVADLFVVITGAEIVLASWSNYLTVEDSGFDTTDPENPVALPDKLKASWGLDQFPAGSVIRLSGLGANDGTFVVATSSPVELTLETEGGAPVVGLAPMTVVATIELVESNNGTYRIVSNAGGYIQLQKVDPITLIDDVSWPGVSAGEVFGADIALHETVLIGDWIGPFVACPPNTTTERIELDFKLAQGLGALNDSGGFDSKTVEVEIEWRDHVAGGAWQSVDHSFTGATNDQLAETVSINMLSPIRPEVRLRRVTPEVDSTRHYDQVDWVSLKAELPSATSYPDVTTVALKIRGTNSLATQAENKFGMIVERVLPVYENGAWSEPRATRDLAPFFAHVIKDLGHTDSQIDLVELQRLHSVWNGRGDTFAAVFDDDSTIFEVLKRVLAVGYAEPTLDYGQIVPVRDEPRAAFEQGYQPDNMLPPGLEWDIKLFDADEPDGIEVEFFDSDTWKSETVLCLLPGDLGANPEKVRAFGITDRTRAWRYGMRKRREKRYRRTMYRFRTEMDALNSRYMSFCALSVDVPGYSQSGRVDAVDGRLVVVNRPLEWGVGVHYMALRRPNGSVSGPYVVSQTSSSDAVLLAADLDFVPVLDGSMEPPLFMFGTAETWCIPALVKDIKPQGTERVAVDAVNYDERVYADDDNSPPA